MPKNVLSNTILFFFLAASALSFLTIAIIIFYPPAAISNVSMRKPLVGAIFLLINIFGGVAALFPRQCTMISGSHKQDKSLALHTTHSNSHIIKGHHPDCKGFSAHIVRINGRVLCAACTGLFLGAATAIVGAMTYFFAGVEFGQFSLFPVFIGMGLVAFGFAQFRFEGFMRLVLNALFVFGAFLILAGIDALTKNLFIDIYVISLIVLWILTRIAISEWNHSRICHFCTLECELKK